MTFCANPKSPCPANTVLVFFDRNLDVRPAARIPALVVQQDHHVSRHIYSCCQGGRSNEYTENPVAKELFNEASFLK